MEEKRIGAANCYLHQLKEWTESHQDIPENDDVVFCGGFGFVEENGTIVERSV